MSGWTRPGGAFVVLAALLGTAAVSPATARAVSVTTYHNDTLRTGWNRSETVLNPDSITDDEFTLQHSVALDDQVDAQPLVVAHQTIAGQGVHTVVYVATENDTVYAIDAATGTILLSRTLGTAFPYPTCTGGNGPRIGIASTPVISTATGSLFVITNTYENGGPVYRLHSLALDTLQDQVPSTVIAGSHQLTDGATYKFSAAFSKQRPALLLSGSFVYAGFGSYCDRPLARGWLLGWSAQNLAPIPNAELVNQTVTTPKQFLSSIWMSGYGPASTGANTSVWFVTGNTDRSGTTYDAVTNLAESVVRIAPDLSRVYRHFTPSDEAGLDADDDDFGSGGVMLLPVQPGFTPQLAAAAGKDGTLYLMNRQTPGHPLGHYAVGACWCGPSYFVGADGVGRIVLSGGHAVTVWRLDNDDSSPTTLTEESQTAIPGGQDPGFFTSISSNGTQAGSAVIWAVSRPINTKSANVTLYAIDPATGGVIYSAVAGTWPNAPANADIVPTVANGRVFVASDGELTIFGLGDPMGQAERAAMTATRAAARARVNSVLKLAPGEHAIYGHILSVDGSSLILQRRDGERTRVDTTAASDQMGRAFVAPGKAVLVIGAYAADGTLEARHLERAKPSADSWLADR